MKHHIIAASLLAAGLFAGPVSQAFSAQPSVVIVHGAFADGSDWAKVIALLQDKGVQVQAVQNPLDSLAGDVAAANRAIDNQPGKVVLVGHSWGGVVITEAGKHEKVANLVYVAAFAPDAGQSVASMTQGEPKAPGTDSIAADSHGWLSMPPQGIARDFAQDVPAAQARVMAATQGPIKATALRRGGVVRGLEDEAVVVHRGRKRPHDPARVAAHDGRADRRESDGPAVQPCAAAVAPRRCGPRDPGCGRQREIRRTRPARQTVSYTHLTLPTKA